MSQLNVACIILARGGSKGLPGKNIKSLLGHPLMAYTVQPAKEANLVDRVIVSTDDESIADVARQLGAEVPFIRPKELSQDLTSSEASLKHALDWLNDNEGYQTDILVYVQIPDLFKRSENIDLVVQALLDDEHLDSAFVGSPDKKNYWKSDNGYSCLTPGMHMSRQSKTPIFREDTGRGCATRARLLMNDERRLGDNVRILEQDDMLIDIHTEFDFWLAEKVLTERKEFHRYRL